MGQDSYWHTGMDAAGTAVDIVAVSAGSMNHAAAAEAAEGHVQHCYVGYSSSAL